LRGLPWLRWLVLMFSISLITPHAHAGLGKMLLRIARKTADDVPTGKLARRGASLKGAKALGAGVAAERVFAKTADDLNRVGVFVAKESDGSLRLVFRGGDEVVHTPSSMRQAVGELDEMGDALPGAGVDVYLDADALSVLDQVPSGANTRLFLANTNGPSWQIRMVETPVGMLHQVQVASNTWSSVADVASHLHRLTPHQLEEAPKVLDAQGCPNGIGEDASALDPATMNDVLGQLSGDVVVVVTDIDDETTELQALAQLYDIDLVVLGLQDVCDDAPAAVSNIHRANTFTDLLGAAATDDDPIEITSVAEANGSLAVFGTAQATIVTAVHRLLPPEDVPRATNIAGTWETVGAGSCVALAILFAVALVLYPGRQELASKTEERPTQGELTRQIRRVSRNNALIFGAIAAVPVAICAGMRWELEGDPWWVFRIVGGLISAVAWLATLGTLTEWRAPHTSSTLTDLESFGDPDMLAKVVDEELGDTETTRLGNTRLTRNWLVDFAAAHLVLLPLQSVVWAYLEEHKHQKLFITIWRSYTLKVVTTDGKTTDIGVKWFSKDKIIDALATRAPHAFYGPDSEAEHLHKHDQVELNARVEARRKL
jgi:hypothetical protein